MSHVMFDTLKFVETLKEAGMPDKQAKALAGAQNEAFHEALENTFATKKDIYLLREDIIHIQSRLKVLEWMIGFVLTGIIGLGALIIKSFF